MLDTTPIINLYGNSTIVYGESVVKIADTMRLITSPLLRKKLQDDVSAVKCRRVPGMNAEESVEYVLGLKKGVVSKLFNKSLKGAAWKIEVGVLMVYLDRTGQSPFELPISTCDMQHLDSQLEGFDYNLSRHRRQRYETFLSSDRCHTPESFAARHLLDILLAALEDWVRLEQAERRRRVADAFDLNDQCRDNRMKGNIMASNLAHIGLHEALIVERWRKSIQPQLELTIAAFEPSQADMDPVERANDEHRSHESFIDQHALWTDVSQLPDARTFVATRHSGHSSLLRMPTV